MNALKKYLIIAMSIVAAGGLFGCEREGPAERAGENIDRSVERGADRVERGADRLQEPVRQDGVPERGAERTDRPVDRD